MGLCQPLGCGQDIRRAHQRQDKSRNDVDDPFVFLVWKTIFNARLEVRHVVAWRLRLTPRKESSTCQRTEHTISGARITKIRWVGCTVLTINIHSTVQTEPDSFRQFLLDISRPVAPIVGSLVRRPRVHFIGLRGVFSWRTAVVALHLVPFTVEHRVLPISSPLILIF